MLTGKQSRDIHLAGGTPATGISEAVFGNFAGQVNTFRCHLAGQCALQCLLGQVGRPGECHGNFPTPKNGNYSNVYGDGIVAIIPRIARRRKKQPAVKQPVVNFSSGGRTRTSGLRVMSPTSYQLLYPAMFWFCKDTHYFFQNKFFWKI